MQSIASPRLSLLRDEKGMNKFLLLFFIIAFCTILAFYATFTLHVTVVYTHLFYIPILLSGMWFYRKAIYVAFYFGVVHVLVTYFSPVTLSINEPLRAVVFLVVAYVIGFVSEKRVKGEEEIRRLNEELKLKVEQRTKELTKERDYTRHLIESSLDFQMTLDKGGIIMDVNRAFEEITGKSRKDLVGTSIYEYLPREEIEKVIARVFEEKKVRNIEITAKMPGKEDLICNISGTLFTTPEGELGVYVSCRDMTEIRRQHETLLIRERQLAHSARLASLGELSTAMAHEINQPLSVISMAAEGIQRDLKKNRLDMDYLPQDIETILSHVKRIDRTITHMRTYARQPGEWRTVEPEKILNNAFIIIGEQLRTHNISVSRHIEKNLPPIETDPNQLEQIFMNILTNARQVLDEKGEEAERAGKRFQKQLVCRIFRESEYVVFEFADNGYGVPDVTKSKIFEPFFTTKEPGQGTGLGLSIAYNIVTRSLNGRIWVEDNEMGGASFKVALPIKME